jgi:hypothetical protein
MVIRGFLMRNALHPRVADKAARSFGVVFLDPAFIMERE